MSSASIFGHKSRLYSASPAQEVMRARWLMRVLPDFGIVQLTGRRVSAIQAHFEQMIDTPLLHWDSTGDAVGYADFLADALCISSADPVYLQHSLRAWAEKGGVLWVVVDGESISSDLLAVLLQYRPLSKTGQFSIRILLKISDAKLRDRSLTALADAIHERVGDPRPDNHKAFPGRIAYPLILIFSVASIATTSYLALQAKLPVAKITVLGDLSQLSVSESSMGAQRLPVNDIAPGISETTVSTVGVESALASDKKEILILIERWASAWQAQNIDEYFSIYANGYSAYKYMSPDEWRLWRRTRLQRPMWINIEVGPVTVERAKEGEMRAKFWQLYRSPSYQDDTLKTLVLRKEVGVWKITDEINEEVRPLSQ